MPRFNLRITGRLIAGFAVMTALLAIAVGYTSFTLSHVNQNVERMVNLRTPVAVQSTQLVGDLYSTLAILRGYLLTGNPQGKAERAATWKEMDARVAAFDAMAQRFTNPENRRKWDQAKALIGEFRSAQQKAEDIAFTPDAFPATKLLVTEAAPRVQSMLAELTKMIDEEDGLEASAERKRLLKQMADARGNLANAAALLRMYLLSGAKDDQQSFARPWANFEKAFASLSSRQQLLTPSQRTSFATVAKARTELAPLPARMFAIRESAEWNMPVNILVTEAAPRAAMILDLLEGERQPDGLRTGGIKANQQAMLAQDSQNVLQSISNLTMIEWALLAFGLIGAALITFLTARSIATPIRNITSVLHDLTNDRIVDVPYVGRSDEIGDIAKATEVFKQSIAQKVINYRVRVALDAVDSNVMIADEQYNIIYMNSSLQKMLRDREAELRKVLPQFDAAKLIGSNMDVFHKNPSHQRKMLDSLTSAIDSHISVGSLKFHLLASPVFSEGKRVGTSIEWKDETAQKAIEGEIDDLIQSAVAGDFSKRLPVAGKIGFMLTLTNAMNTLSGNIETVMNDMVRMFSALADGNFRDRIDADYQGSFGRLKDDANTMADRISAIVSEIQAAASEVTNASNEIAVSTTDLSQRTEEQAASLEQTSASLEEVSATVKKNAENAQVASQSATDARVVAERGGAVVGDAVQAMSKIEESSRQITDIIGVIDEIARQTNLLALNAAVEAARAGEAGRGFAVVASEVRNLAQRSSQAAKDIKDLISNSGSQVTEGVRLVNQTGSALTEIVQAIKQVADVITEIAAASAEQAGGLDQVNKAIAQMDEVTQRNSALVEENAATAKTLEQQATNMSERIAFFQIADAGAKGVARAAAPVRKAAGAQDPARASSPAGAARRGPVGRMQAALATAIKQEPDWKEF